MMKKTLLVSTSLLLAASTMSAAVPAGELHLIGLNGVTTPDAANLFIPGERDEEDIDEGLWRWSIGSVEVTETTGTITIQGADNFLLGFDDDNEFGFTNNLTATQSMLYLAENGFPVNYDLKAGEYAVSLACFEDIEGDNGGDSWILQFTSKSGGEDDSFYLIGFNDVELPQASARFVKNVVEEDGETFITYILPKYYISECPAGFNVYDSGNDLTYGLSPEFAAMTPEVTEESPMAFLGVGGENVACKLPEGYYDVTYAPTGSITMISFIKCEDQTANNELDYYLLGLNGVFEKDDANKFTRKVETEEYEEDGETISYETITYSLATEVKGECSVTIVSEDGKVVFGYNSDMAAFMPNDFSATSPFASLVQNGTPLNCSLPDGKYIFTFTFVDNAACLLSAVDNESGAVEEIETSDAVPVYYDLQGRQVRNPARGIYIVKKGAKVSKVAL